MRFGRKRAHDDETPEVPEEVVSDDVVDPQAAPPPSRKRRMKA